jgi:hypothetical protein
MKRAVAILIAGALLRIVLMPLHGFRGDLEMFRVWSSTLKESGIAAVYRKGAAGEIMPCNYPPLYLYCLAGVAWTGQRVGLLEDFDLSPEPMPRTVMGPSVLFALKTPALFIDLFTMWMLYRFWRTRRREGAGLLAMAAYAFCPPSVFDSACWGQTDTILAALLAGVTATAIRRNGLACGGLIAASMLFKPQGVLSIPIWIGIVLAGGIQVVRSYDSLRFIGGTAISALLVSAAVVFPVWKGGELDQLAKVYTESIGKHTAVTVQAFNAWYVWSGKSVYRDHQRRTNDLTKAFGLISYRAIGMAAFAAFCVAAWGAAARGRAAPEELPALGFSVVWAFFICNTQMHERYGVPAMVFLVFCIPLSWRFVVMYGLLSMTNLWNLFVVYDTFPAPARWISQAMIYPKSWIYDELGFVLSLMNCVVLFWSLEYLYRWWGRRPNNRVTSLGQACPTSSSDSLT